MTEDVGAVNISSEGAVTTPDPPSDRPRYHHGNLAAALLDAGFDLAREGGPTAVVVREASRRVAGSHNAAYRHIPDRDALLAAVCERCMSELARLMERLIEEVPPGPDPLSTAEARLRATGRAYVRFALREPGLFRTAFSVPEDLPEADRPHGVGESGLGPLELLGRELDGLLEAGGMAPERRPGAELVAWSAVHGLSALLLDGPLRGLGETEREAAIEALLRTVQRGFAR